MPQGLPKWWRPMSFPMEKWWFGVVEVATMVKFSNMDGFF
jgi:hypothetical protein